MTVTKSQPVLPGKATVVVEHLPAKLIEVLDVFLGTVKARNGGFAKIQIEIADGNVKRFECIESYLMSAL